MNLKPFLLATLLGAGPAPSFADLAFCNETDETVSIAIGYDRDGSWVSEGWWTMASGDCTTPISGDLPNRYYYWRATSPSYSWEDDAYMFCTAPKEFTILTDKQCVERGYDSNPFNELDIGESREWTMTLTASEAIGNQQPDPEAAYEQLHAKVHAALQGYWLDLEDDAFGMAVEDHRLTDYFANIAMGSSTWSLADTCDGARGAGPVLIVTDDGDPEPICWVILDLNADEFLFRAVGGTADIHMVKQTR